MFILFFLLFFVQRYLSIYPSVCLHLSPSLSLQLGLVDWFRSELRFNSATHPDLLRSKHDEYFIKKKKKIR